MRGGERESERAKERGMHRACIETLRERDFHVAVRNRTMMTYLCDADSVPVARRIAVKSRG